MVQLSLVDAISLVNVTYPALNDRLTYTQGAGGYNHIVLLRSGGSAIACGFTYSGPCNIPALVDQLTYTQVAASTLRTVLLRSDGSAFVF